MNECFDLLSDNQNPSSIGCGVHIPFLLADSDTGTLTRRTAVLPKAHRLSRRDFR